MDLLSIKKHESIAPHCWPFKINLFLHVCLMLFSVYELHYARVSARHRATTSFRKTHVLYRFFKVSIFFFHGVGENFWPQPIRSSELGCLTSHSYATLNSVILEARSYLPQLWGLSSGLSSNMRQVTRPVLNKWTYPYMHHQATIS